MSHHFPAEGESLRPSSHAFGLLFSVFSSIWHHGVNARVGRCAKQRAFSDGVMAGGVETRIRTQRAIMPVVCEAEDLTFGEGVSGAGPCARHSPKG